MKALPIGVRSFADLRKKDDYASGKFAELIERLYEKIGRQTVVLVDEYDMPILDALNNTEELEADFKEYIHGFAPKSQVTDSQIIESIRHWYNGYSWDGECRMEEFK